MPRTVGPYTWGYAIVVLANADMYSVHTHHTCSVNEDEIENVNII